MIILLSPSSNFIENIPGRGYINLILRTQTNIKVFFQHSSAVYLYVQKQTFN